MSPDREDPSVPVEKRGSVRRTEMNIFKALLYISKQYNIVLRVLSIKKVIIGIALLDKFYNIFQAVFIINKLEKPERT